MNTVLLYSHCSCVVSSVRIVCVSAECQPAISSEVAPCRWYMRPRAVTTVSVSASACPSSLSDWEWDSPAPTTMELPLRGMLPSGYFP